MNSKWYYAVFLDLEQKRCLVVGGGAVAERKVQELLDAQADVLVVSPSLTDTLSQLAGTGAIQHLPRQFCDDDVQGCALVIGATDQVELKAQVAAAARRRAVWVNVVDTPAACDFIAPALVRRGALQIAISTGGNSPTLAKRLRHGLEQLIGPEYGVLVDVLGRLRAASRWWAEPPEVRKATFERVMDASGLPLLSEISPSHGRCRCQAIHRPGGGGTAYAGVAENAAVAIQAPQQERRMQLTRRDFLTVSMTGTLALLLAGLPRGWIGGVYAGDGPETPKVRIGIIALTDCSSIVMAHELGLFKKYGIESTISKEASWAVIRDRLSLGENQATHLLLGMPYASTMGLLGSPVKPMIIPFYLNRNGQAITLTKALLGKGVKTPQALKPSAEEARRAGKPMTFAMTFPPGTHAMWMRYWLGAGGINPDKDVTLITIPPPQMVANMKVGKMDGFCVGEPWNARAIADGIGFTAITTQQMWRDHPEKVLGFTEEFAEKNPKTVKALLRALLEASQYLDKLDNRPHVAEVVARPQYINTQKEVILGRLLGQYDYGDGGALEQDPYYMTFFDRQTNFPWRSHGVWWLSQFRRWGMAKEEVDYTGLVARVHRPDIFREVAKEMGIDAPGEDMKKETLFDGIEFDPAQPEQYVRMFAVHNLAQERGAMSKRFDPLAYLLPLIGIGLVLLAWTLLSQTVAPDLPSPLKTWEESKEYVLRPFFKDGEMHQGIGRFALLSLVRVAKGFVVAIMAGTLLGYLLGLSIAFHQAFDPVIQVLRPISPLAWLPLGLVIFRQSEPAAIFTIAICAMWPTVINTAVGVRSIPQDYLNVGRVLRLSRTKMLRKVIIPATLPYIFTGWRLSLGIAWLVIVASEMLTGAPGIGGFLWQEYNSLVYSHILLSIITIGLIGFLLDRLMGAVERRFRVV